MGNICLALFYKKLVVHTHKKGRGGFMYSVVIAFGLASVMLCIGMFIRGKVKFFQNMLMPVSVIGGVIGFVFLNLVMTKVNIGGATVQDFSNIVDVFFVLSFISIGLTGEKKKKSSAEPKAKKTSGPVRGGLGMSIIWSMLYALTPAVGIVVVALVGKLFHMDAMYGILIPFAFCQGPGQASTYGKLFENVYGFPKAEMVAITFAVCGFLAAFLVGVPMARYGLKKGLVKNKSKINSAVERGYFMPEEQREPVGKSTFHSANIETIAAHFSIMGVCYLLGVGLAKLMNFIPGIGSTLSAMLFMWCMFAAYIVKGIMRKLNLDYLINNTLQGRITGFFSDYLVVCAFMAIQLDIIGSWIIPILLVSVAGTVVTAVVCIFFCARLGSDHDFERMLGVYGTSTGTTPSGVSLLRIVDPKLQTPTGEELGIMNMTMILSSLPMTLITLAGLKVISLPVTCGGMLLSVVIYMILLKVFRVWKKKPTFTFIKGKRYEGEEEDAEIPFLKGYLHIDTMVVENKIMNNSY